MREREMWTEVTGRGAAEGAVAAMAMSGMRLVTTELGWVRQVPPESVVVQEAPRLIRRMPKRYRRLLIEFLHWSYGAGGGAVFANVPARWRSWRFSGPAYGLGVWLLFEAILSPALKLRRRGEHHTVERLALAADHVLYGLIISRSEALSSGRLGADGSESPSSEQRRSELRRED